MGLLLSVLTSVSLLNQPSAVVAVEQVEVADCEAPELVVVGPEYNRLVCEGIRLMHDKRYGEAIAYLEEAAAMRLFELPNFWLFPRLALAYTRAGEMEKAQETLRKARISLSVSLGIYECSFGEDGAEARIRDGQGELLTSTEAVAVAQRMCGELYEPYYRLDSLEDLMEEFHVLEIYVTAKNEIERASTPENSGK